jgi:hypothetical protein
LEAWLQRKNPLEPVPQAGEETAPAGETEIEPAHARAFRDRESRAWMGDLEGDGNIETLFIHYVKSLDKSSNLICFSEDGREKWRYTPSKAVETRKDHFTSVFTIGAVLVSPMGRGRPNSVLVSGFQFPEYPAQISLLSNKGEKQREYWHAGHIGSYSKMHVADLDNNGINEIYLGGVNNSYKQGTMVALDPDSFEGASIEENPDYQLLGVQQYPVPDP